MGTAVAAPSSVWAADLKHGVNLGVLILLCSGKLRRSLLETGPYTKGLKSSCHCVTVSSSMLRDHRETPKIRQKIALIFPVDDLCMCALAFHKLHVDIVRLSWET